MSEAAESYREAWFNIICDVTGDPTKATKAIVSAELNGLFNIVIRQIKKKYVISERFAELKAKGYSPADFKNILPVRVINCISNEFRILPRDLTIEHPLAILTISDAELKRVPNFGHKSLSDLREWGAWFEEENTDAIDGAALDRLIKQRENIWRA